MMDKAQALGAIGAPAKPKLLALLKDPKDTARCMGACMAIHRITPVDPEAVTELTRLALHAKVEDLRDEAMNALGEIGPAAVAAVPHLIRALDKETKLRWRVAFTLGMIGPQAKDALPALRRYQHDKDQTTTLFVGNAITSLSAGEVPLGEKP